MTREPELLDLPVPTRVLFGTGSVEELGARVAQLGDSAMIVCGRTAMRANGTLDRVQRNLTASGVRTLVHEAISANPRSDEVDRAVALATADEIEVVIGLGGGSALDAAKAVAIGIAHGPVGPLVGAALAHSASVPPVVAVPTTAGSGSEVTKGAIITDVERGFKSGIRGENLFPALALVDPDLSASVPHHVAVDAGFDAFAHHVEGFLAQRSTELNEAICERALRLLAPALHRLARGESSADLREDLSLAATLGGVNVATASTCLPHRLQQAMGTASNPGPSHGAGLALLYPAWASALVPHASERMTRLASFLDGTDLQQEIARLLQALGVRPGLRHHGYTADDLPHFVRRISGNLDNDPHPAPTGELALDIFQRAF